MAAYALVQNKNILSVGLPKTWNTSDGREIKDFDELSAAELKQYGWLPINDPGAPRYPDIDPNTQSLDVSINIGSDKVDVVYKIVERQKAPQEQIDALSALLVKKGIVTGKEVADSKKPTLPPPAT